MKIKRSEMRSLLLGAAFFSTGGGGTVEAGEHLIEGIEEVEIINPDEAEKEAFTATAFFAGSIKSPTLEELRRQGYKLAIEEEGELLSGSFDVLQSKLEGKIKYIIPVELGGHNTAVSLYLAGKKGVAVLDCDLTGRSAPEMYQTSYYVGDISPTPAGVFTIFGEGVYVENMEDYDRFDKLLRYLVELSYGYDVGVSCFPLRLRDAFPYLLKGTLSLSLRIGKLLEKGDLFAALSEAGAEVIFSGEVKEEEFQVREGFTFGRVKIQGKEGELILEYKNEILVAKLAGKIIASVPDLIGVINEEAKPVLNTKFRQGEKVLVYKIPSPPIWRSPKGLEVFGLQHFCRE